jgi:hypothetical protein
MAAPKGLKASTHKRTGRLPGKPNPRGLASIVKKEEHIYATLLASALAGDSFAGRTCLELIGKLPAQDIVEGALPKITLGQL